MNPAFITKRGFLFEETMDTYKSVLNALEKLKNPQKAAVMASFFKTGKGQYAEGDIFWGLTAPEIKKIVKQYYKQLSLPEIKKLLDSPVHESRSVGLQCLVMLYARADESGRKELAEFYIENISAVNNWDLVDTTAPHILGAWEYENNETAKIWNLARSQNLWKERVAVVSTLYFIRRDVFEPTIELSEYFLSHKHDLMHKACGWMLREVGKHNEKVLIGFLNKYSKQMPRTMLRYSLERLTPEQRKHYMQK